MTDQEAYLKNCLEDCVEDLGLILTAVLQESLTKEEDLEFNKEWKETLLSLCTLEEKMTSLINKVFEGVE
jgi:hypothetical protein